MRISVVAIVDICFASLCFASGSFVPVSDRDGKTPACAITATATARIRAQASPRSVFAVGTTSPLHGAVQPERRGCLCLTVPSPKWQPMIQLSIMILFCGQADFSETVL
ncbi:hypothetical protein LIA77_02391 [Sarocladium implicatum]|nr:hypothetical protein LIA77_02391 [Sarocladium implicatum]